MPSSPPTPSGAIRIAPTSRIPLRRNEEANRRRDLYFPHVLRDARRIGEYYPGLSPNSPESMDRLGVSLAHLESRCANFYDAAEVERVFYPEIEKLLLDFFPGATDALVYNHDVFDKDYAGDRTEDQDNKNPGVNARYANLVHNDLNDNSGPRALPRAAHEEPAELRPHAALHRGGGRREDVPALHVDQSRQADGDGRAVSLRALRLAFFADQPYITNYRIYDDRVGETTRFTNRPDHEWYWFPRQKPNRSLDAEVL